jgi:hypothetical protein
MVSAITITVLWLIFLAVVGAAAFVYLDAPEYGMNAYKWAAITLFMPFFGFFAYVFERGERIEDPDWDRPEDAFVDGTFSVHKSRADDAGWVTSADESGEDAMAATDDDQSE